MSALAFPFTVGQTRALASLVCVVLIGCSTETPTVPTAAPSGVGLIQMSSKASTTDASDREGCPGDSKLVGIIEVSTADEPGTWWRLTKEGFIAAGYLTPTQWLEFMEELSGLDFNTLDDAVADLVSHIEPFDLNDNGLICAYSVTGTKTGWGDPDGKLYHWRVRDDKQAGK